MDEDNYLLNMYYVPHAIYVRCIFGITFCDRKPVFLKVRELRIRIFLM